MASRAGDAGVGPALWRSGDAAPFADRIRRAHRQRPRVGPASPPVEPSRAGSLHDEAIVASHPVGEEPRAAVFLGAAFGGAAVRLVGIAVPLHQAPLAGRERARQLTLAATFEVDASEGDIGAMGPAH